MLTESDFQNLQDIFPTKEYLDQKFEHELSPIKEDIRSIKIDIKEVREIVSKIDTRDLEDSNMLTGIAMDHERRLKILEKLDKH